MSTLSELFKGVQNEGGAAPLGSITTLFGAAGDSIIRNKTEVYLRTGVTVLNPSESILALSRAAGGNFEVPGATTSCSILGASGGIASIGSLFVRVGDGGTFRNSLWYSEDGGVSWAMSNGLVNARVMSSVVAFNGKFYVGALPSSSQLADLHPVMLSSPDGKNWTTVAHIAPNNNSPITTPAISLSVANNILFATLASNTASVYSSSDGTVWAKATLSTSPSGCTYASKVAFNGTRYVFNAGTQSSANTYYATDPRQWTLGTGSLSISGSVSVLNGTFYLAGVDTGGQHYIQSSADGITWTTRSNTGGAIAQFTNMGTDLAWNGNTSSPVYVCVLSNGVKHSTNGTSWTFVSVNGGGSQVMFAGGKFIIAGSASSVATAATSTNGSTWTTLSPLFTVGPGTTVPSVLMQRLFFDGSFVWMLDAQGSMVKFNSDLTSMSKVLSTPPTARVKLVNDKLFMFIPDDDVQIAESSDGKFRYVSVGATAPITDASYANAVYICVGSNKINRSTATNALTWTEVFSGGTHNNVATDGSTFVTGAGTGTVATRYSIDGGLNWLATVSTSGVYPTTSIGFANGFWASLAAGTDSLITSLNGIDWSLITLPATYEKLSIIGKLFWIQSGANAPRLIVAPDRTVAGVANTFGAGTASTYPPMIGYNSVTDRYMSTVSSGFTVSTVSSVLGIGEATSSTSTWDVGSQVTTTQFQSSASIALIIEAAIGAPRNGLMVEIADTGNVVIITGLGPMISVGGTHFVNLRGVIFPDVGANEPTQQGTFITTTRKAMYISTVSSGGAMLCVEINALFSGISRMSSGAAANAQLNAGMTAHYRRIA